MKLSTAFADALRVSNQRGASAGELSELLRHPNATIMSTDQRQIRGNEWHYRRLKRLLSAKNVKKV